MQVRYTPAEQELVDRVQAALPVDDREHGLFCSYARIDGEVVTDELYAALTVLGLEVWRDKAEMKPGRSMARQLDNGLRLARAGVLVLTPAYLAGRFWTERELGALLHKDSVIPVLHNVTFTDVREYSSFLGDMMGFDTAEDSVEEIAAKIASALIDPTVIDPPPERLRTRRRARPRRRVRSYLCHQSPARQQFMAKAGHRPGTPSASNGGRRRKPMEALSAGQKACRGRVAGREVGALTSSICDDLLLGHMRVRCSQQDVK
ncbi:toll/interleukin-1 receptor domain-containing protein [Micromonospora sp. NPDC051141]|uniref:toll/interleukin-1 receptor domain-containing protein n=1 Tax=Micromonospora sp. NPDC051141 TaxID=3364284 RepID=UPI0037B52EB6